MTSRTTALTGRRVLLVEDDYFIANAMRGQFEENGAQVLGPVPSVRSALALIAATPEIDAAVLDINLQEEWVFPVADALRARGVSFVFATGYDRGVIPLRFGDVGHYEKPVEAAQIATALFG